VPGRSESLDAAVSLGEHLTKGQAGGVGELDGLEAGPSPSTWPSTPAAWASPAGVAGGRHPRRDRGSRGVTPCPADLSRPARTLLAALVTGVVGRLLARRSEAPAALWMVPTILPLLPAPSTLLSALAQTDPAHQALQRLAEETAFLIGGGRRVRVHPGPDLPALPRPCPRARRGHGGPPGWLATRAARQNLGKTTAPIGRPCRWRQQPRARAPFGLTGAGPTSRWPMSNQRCCNAPDPWALRKDGAQSRRRSTRRALIAS
jgi:hypothetical protein